jgi:hypothetical protein
MTSRRNELPLGLAMESRRCISLFGCSTSTSYDVGTPTLGIATGGANALNLRILHGYPQIHLNLLLDHLSYYL